MARQLGLFFLLFTLAFVIGGIAIALDEPLLGAIGFTGLVLAAVVSIVLTSARIRSGNSRLVGMAGVRSGRATILQARPTALFVSMGESRYKPRTYRLRLRVEVDGRQPYEINHYEAAYPWSTGHLGVGQVLPCLVHPSKDAKVHLDFGHGGATTGVGEVTVAGLDQIPWPTTSSATVVSGGAGSIDVDDLVRRATGSDLQGLLARVQGGEQVPGVVVNGLDALGAGPAPFGVDPGGSVPFGADPGGSAPGFGDVDASVVVNGVRDLGATTTGDRSIELDLLVAIPGQTPYRVVQVVERAAARVPRTGETLRVRVDPARPSEVRLPD